MGVPAAGSVDENPSFGFETQVAYAGFREETDLREKQRKAGEREEEKLWQGKCGGSVLGLRRDRLSAFFSLLSLLRRR